MAFEDYYLMNPMSVVDQNLWTDRIPEVIANFHRGPTIYSPLIDWTDRSQSTGAQYSQFTDLLEGDVNSDAITMSQMYIDEPVHVDSRMRQITTLRYGDKVQLHETSNIFQMWKMSGQRDWRPLLRGVLGNNVRRKMEILARNAHLLGPSAFWTYPGAVTDFSGLTNTSTFNIEAVNGWNLRLGNTGTPVIPGDRANAKVAIVPPGVIYDFQTSLAGASQSEAQMWRDAVLYQEKLSYEIGTYKNIRFVEVPNDNYGENMAVLYNCGAITFQASVVSAITAGDGAPDPETTAVDDTWYVGQKGVTHYIQLDTGEATNFAVHDMVSIHNVRTSTFGVTNGVNPLAGKTIVRRVVSVDTNNDRLAFNRPVMFGYAADLGSGVYAYVTKAQHVGMILVLGSRGGILGNVNRPLKFYEPKPVDDFESVWRYVWDIIAGLNIWEPNLFEVHFVSVTLPKPGGVISPVAIGS